MSQSDDLTKLFKRFGGDTTSYREIVRSEGAQQARARWPLLSAVQADRPDEVPPVSPGELAGAMLRQPPAPPQAELAPPPQAPLPASPFASPRPPLPVRTAGLPPAGAPSPLQSPLPSPLPMPAAPATPAAPVAHPGLQGMPASAAVQPIQPAQPTATPLAAKLTLKQRLAGATVPPPPPPPAPAPAYVAPPVQFASAVAAASANAASQAAGTELTRVFARLEGRSADPASERAQLRRSLLDRLKRP